MGTAPRTRSVTRSRLTQEAEKYRKSLFDNGKTLTDTEKRALYDYLRNLPGCQKYSKKVHDQFCRRHERDVLARARKLIKSELDELWTQGTILNYYHTASLARKFQLSFEEANRIVIELVGADIVRVELQMAEVLQQA